MQQTKFKELPLSPYQIVRLSDGPIFFGFGPTQLAEKIKLGEIPEPKYLTSMGRARGWTGEQIIDWHRATLLSGSAMVVL